MDQGNATGGGVVIGQDRAINETVNWAALSHQELYDAVHQDNDPGQTSALAGEWHALGAEMAESSRVMDQQIRATESGWQGTAAESARAATLQLASWGSGAALTSQDMAARINDQGRIVETAKAAMPEPVNFDIGKELAIGFASGGLLGLAIAGADVKAKSDQARAAHDHAVDVMTTMESGSRLVDGSTPQFVPPPNVVAPPPAGAPQPFVGTPRDPGIPVVAPVPPGVPSDPAGASPGSGDPAGYQPAAATAPAAWAGPDAGGSGQGDPYGGAGFPAGGGGHPVGSPGGPHADPCAGSGGQPGGGVPRGVPYGAGDGGGYTAPAAYAPPTTNPRHAGGYGGPTAAPDYGQGQNQVRYPQYSPQWGPSSSFGPRGSAAANEMADPNYWSRRLGSGGEPGPGGETGRGGGWARPGAAGAPGTPAFGPTGRRIAPGGGAGGPGGGFAGEGGFGAEGAGRMPSGAGAAAAGESGPRGSGQPLGPGAASAAAEQPAAGRSGAPGGRGAAEPGGAPAAGPMGAGAGARGGAQDKERRAAGYIKGEKIIEEPGRIVPPVIGATFKKKQP
jgi:hypothetical protein